MRVRSPRRTGIRPTRTSTSSSQGRRHVAFAGARPANRVGLQVFDLMPPCVAPMLGASPPSPPPRANAGYCNGGVGGRRARVSHMRVLLGRQWPMDLAARSRCRRHSVGRVGPSRSSSSRPCARSVCAGARRLADARGSARGRLPLFAGRMVACVKLAGWRAHVR